MPSSIKRLSPKVCLPKMISYLSHKYEGSKPHDQIVAIAASECGISRKNDIGLDAGIRAALHLAHYKEKYPQLSLHENLARAYDKIMRNDMEFDFIVQNGKEGTMDEIFLQIKNDFEDLTPKENIIEKVKQIKIKEGSPKKEILKKINKNILEELDSNKELFIRWANTKKDIEKPSFEIYENIILGIEDISEIAFGLYKRGLLPDEIEEQDELEWEDYTETLLEKARNKDLGAQKDILEAYLESNQELYYDVKERIVEGKKQIGFEAGGVNVSTGGAGMGVPSGIRYLSYLKGDVMGDNLQNDGYILNISKIMAIYDNELKQFVHLDPSLKQGKGKGWHGESERHSKAKKTGKADLTEDAESRGPGRPRKPGLKTFDPSKPETFGAAVSGAKRTTVGQSLKGQGVPLSVEGPESVTLPFKMVNTESGEIVEGEMTENLDKGTAQMQPVSSSNVRSVGQAQNELVVAFHSSGEGGFYRYKFANPEMATEARHALIESGSPGRWVWHNIRGHVAGEPVTSTKMGPAITSGKPTIGGTSASLVQYTTSKTAPSRVVGYKEAHEKLQRQTSNPQTDPSTGARIEGLLGARKGFRELGRKIKQDHACDFTMEGMLTRSGEFDYRAEGQGIKIKTPENLKWIAKNTDHVPVFGKRNRGAHKESEVSLIGFAHNFGYVPVGQVDDYAHIKGKVELFHDIKDLSDLDDPSDLPVSFGFDDMGDDKYQNIVRLHHLAVSLNKVERDRCSTMDGTPCTISRKQDMSSNITIRPLKKIVVSIQK